MRNKLKGYVSLVLAYIAAYIISNILGMTIVGAACHIIFASFDAQRRADGATEFITWLLVPMIACVIIYFIKLDSEEEFEYFEKQIEGKEYSMKQDLVDSFKSVDLWSDIAIVTLVTVIFWIFNYFAAHIWLNIPIYIVFAFLSNLRMHFIWNNTLKDTSPEDNDGTKRGRLQIEEHEIGSVARARAYGGTRRIGLLDRFNEFAAHILYMFYRGWAFFVLFLYALILIALLSKIGVVIWVCTIVCVVYFKVLKLPRKRMRLYFRIKRVCKKHNCRMEVTRSALRSLRYSDKGFDFKVDMGRDVYCVRMFTVQKNNSRVTFNDKNNVNVIYPCPSANRIVSVKNGAGTTATVRTHEARGFGIMRVKAYQINLPQNAQTLSYKNEHKVLLVHLTPREMFKKARDGGVCQTGTGENMGEYVIYTAHDFINNLIDKKQTLYPNKETYIGH